MTGVSDDRPAVADPVTTSTGTTVSVVHGFAGLTVVCDNPAAPDDMRNCEVGRIIDGGFQPVAFCPFGLRPEVLRAIATFIETPTEEAAADG